MAKAGSVKVFSTLESLETFLSPDRKQTTLCCPLLAVSSRYVRTLSPNVTSFPSEC